MDLTVKIIGSFGEPDAGGYINIDMHLIDHVCLGHLWLDEDLAAERKPHIGRALAKALEQAE